MSDINGWYSAYCPHCGNKAPQSMRRFHECAIGEEELVVYYAAVCSTCSEPLLYSQGPLTRTYGSMPGPQQFFPHALRLLWPKLGSLHESVPEPIRGKYEEAVGIKTRSPSAFASQIGVALERLCKERGASGNNLAGKLGDLNNRGILPNTLAEMAHSVRAFRNLGSHADDADEVTASDADAIDEFFRAVVEYVYVAPHRVQEVRNRLDRAGQLGET
ncbi:MAG TPA: DUF4145 domain-containing protein [Fimbriiglobus sp.]|nr:DUF4145 domain-containing protein [Fimbriiglobus sp.]